MRDKYQKSEYQKFKEKYKIPWSIKTLTNFWNKLNSRPHQHSKKSNPMEQIQLRMKNDRET